MPERLTVQAASTGRVYIGASFCRDDKKLHSLYMNIDPSDCLSILAAQQYVRSGGSPEEAIQSTHLPEHVIEMVRGCLGAIASGECAKTKQ